MSVQEEYSSYILEQVIKELLEEGIVITPAIVAVRYNAIIKDKDLSQPLFDLDIAKTVSLEHASAGKVNNTNDEILRDLVISYRELFKITGNSIDLFDRWRTEIAILESQLKKLNARIDNLLATRLRKGMFIVSDEFQDTSHIDQEFTDAYIDLKNQLISLRASHSNPTKLNLNNILAKDVKFSVLTKSNLKSIVTAPGGEAIHAFHDTDNFWQTRVVTVNAKEPITGEMIVKIADYAVDLTKITIKLHTANTTSSLQITPLLSKDGINFTQLPVVNPTLAIVDTANWMFDTQQATHVKFIMTKIGYDFIDNEAYIYEFGAEEIAFYKESYINDIQTMRSTLWQAVDYGNRPISINKVTLSACERVLENTEINYFIGAQDSGDINWIPIDPEERSNPKYPSTIDLGEIKTIELANNSKISIDRTTDPVVKPSNIYNYYRVYDESYFPDRTAVTTNNAGYYKFVNNEDYLLDLFIDDHDIVEPFLPLIIEKTVEIFRNVGKRNTSINNYENILVRNVRAGWGFEDPYYTTVINIENTLDTFTIDFGDKEVIIDANKVKGKNILTHGLHSIKVHKDNWVSVPGGLTTIDDLKAHDPLFPYNHKLLIEGYDLEHIENPYIGVHIFAEYYMKQVSIADMISNVKANDFSKFGIDLASVAEISIPLPDETVEVQTNPAPFKVIMVKSDNSRTDSLTEEFKIRFIRSKKLYTGVYFKAELSSSVDEVTPLLDSYKLKLVRG